MIVGISLILVVFSYLAYRRLQCPSSAAPGLSMWPPFLSILRPQATSSKTTTTTAATAAAAASPLHEADETTPKAKPVTPSLVVPEISLDADSDDDDAPPAFPAMHSAQRAGRVQSSIPPPAFQMSMMPPPPRPRPSAASQARQSSLAVVGKGASGVAAGNGLKLNGSRSNSKSRKVTLEPGHSPLDWARLQKSGVDLRGLPHAHLLKVPPSLLAKHKKSPQDIWMALDGKVYNVTAYIPFHPGGDKELLRGAGKDGTKLFTATHPWVNVEGMLGECLVGILVSEEEARQNPEEGELEAVD